MALFDVLDELVYLGNMITVESYSREVYRITLGQGGEYIIESCGLIFRSKEEVIELCGEVLRISLFDFDTEEETVVCW